MIPKSALKQVTELRVGQSLQDHDSSFKLATKRVWAPGNDNPQFREPRKQVTKLRLEVRLTLRSNLVHSIHK